jgi:hypothetical protein
LTLKHHIKFDFNFIKKKNKALNTRQRRTTSECQSVNRSTSHLSKIKTTEEEKEKDSRYGY